MPASAWRLWSAWLWPAAIAAIADAIAVEPDAADSGWRGATLLPTVSEYPIPSRAARVLADRETTSLQLENASYTLRFPPELPQFCSEHWAITEPWVDGLPVQCQAPCSAPPGAPHAMFMHIEKTAGSTIECAWQSASDNGLVDLLGHMAPLPSICADVRAACASRCEAVGVPIMWMMAVRDPYSYWGSVYQYAWKCLFGACGSTESQAALTDDLMGINCIRGVNSGSGPGCVAANTSVPLAQQQGKLRSFATFLEHVASGGTSMWRTSISETARIQTKCGEPCRVDEVLRQERLTEDWEALLRKYPGLPQVALPRINEEDDGNGTHPWGAPPEATYTPQLRAIVDHIEKWVWETFYGADEPERLWRERQREAPIVGEYRIAHEMRSLFHAVGDAVFDNWPPALQPTTGCCAPLLLAGEAREAYFQAVYGEAAAGVNVSSLGFFYWHKTLPLHGVCLQLVDLFFVSPNDCAQQEGVAFVAANTSGVPATPTQEAHRERPGFGLLSRPGYYPAWCNSTVPGRSCGPAVVSAGLGFLVHHSRTAYLASLPRPLVRVEVLHLAFAEPGVSWFWLTQGTGVFIQVDALAAYGRVVQLSGRFDPRLGCEDDASCLVGVWKEDDPGPFLQANNVSAIIFENDDYGVTMNVLPEMVVRLPILTDEQRASPCPVPSRMLSTGWSTPQPCACDPSPELGMLNCGVGSASYVPWYAS